ncbi:hypothetical protein ABFX02_06G146300 [Erythranthe guttata]
MFTYLITLAILFVLSAKYCFCMDSQSLNNSFVSGFSPAVATWYGSPNGAGSGGACGFANDVANPPYNGLISAGNQNIFKHGQGCGNCYQVKCTENPACSGFPIVVTVTDECPGTCNNEAFHFDLSGKAFGYLAKLGQADKLRNAGRINIQYQRVPCKYNTGITFKIDTGSNANYLAFSIEFVGGDGDIGSVELLPSKPKGSLYMQKSWGCTWKVGIPVGTNGPYSVKLTTIESRSTIIATNAIPGNWSPGKYYHSAANFS